MGAAMNVWQFLDRCLGRLPGWPSERQWVTIWLFILIFILLAMASANPELWTVEVFKVVMQAVVLTGALNMVLAFHFAANKGDETKAENTGKAFDAITATANAATPDRPDVVLAPGETAQAAPLETKDA
jgi:hypothetical protein